MINLRRYNNRVGSGAYYNRSCYSYSSLSNSKDGNAIASPSQSSSTDTTQSQHNNQAIKVLLPKFGQNGTLKIYNSNDDDNSISIRQVQIIPQWRDDALIELVPLLSDNNDIDADDSVEIATFDYSDKSSASDLTTTQTFGKGSSMLNITNHTNGILTSLGRKGSLVEVNFLNSNSNNDANTRNNNVNIIPHKLIATIPEKSNLTCQLLGNSNTCGDGGDINIDNKLEGDIHLSTTKGNITVSKLRGHNITLNTTNGIIHIRKAIEAKCIQINTLKRVRAQMLNGSNISVNVTRSRKSSESSADDNATASSFVADGSSHSASSSSSLITKLDEDDGGALIDIGSLYISSGGGDGGSYSSDNEATLIVLDGNNNTHNNKSGGGLVRVKSSHGHVTVHAKTNNKQIDDGQQQHPPLIDMGGVNGSCDITLDVSRTHDNNTNTNNNICSIMGTRIHFDAMTPESISTFTSRGGRVVGHSSITMDRKLEAEVRMLSLSKSNVALPNTVDAHSFTSDDNEEIQSTLMDVNNTVIRQQQQDKEGNSSVSNSSSNSSSQSSISIETDAYNSHDHLQIPPLSNGVEYTQGAMTNRSGEPDSRFDIAHSAARGKINIDGAASQALHSFQNGRPSEDATSASAAAPLPLLAVATDGSVKLETLSWFGSIARRYGLEEEKGDGRKVGRQASRLPRLDK